MMELDDLKSIWKDQPAFEAKDAAQIADMLKKKSNSIASRLKRSVWFELTVTLVATVLMFLYVLTLPGGYVQYFFSFAIVVFVAYLVYYVKKLSVINKFQHGDGNLKETIEKLVATLTVYLKFYRRSYSLLYPISFVVGLGLGAVQRGFDNFFQALLQPRVFLPILGVLGLFIFAATWFTTWYLKKLYGNHVEKLKEILKDLET
jgi:Ca2+/Na+ antiporter